LKDPQDEAAYIYVYCTASRNGIANQAFALGTYLESSTGAVRHLEVGDPIITPAADGATKAAPKSPATIGTYEYGLSVCVDL
jgi:hypothetical protein